MQKLYVALNTKQYAELTQQKVLPPTNEDKGSQVFFFTEDKHYWIRKIEEQQDVEDIHAYTYAFIIEFKLAPSVLKGIVESVRTGRCSQRIYEYYRQLGKATDIPEYKPDDVNVLCVMDVYESSETADGVSQLWMLKVENTQSELWRLFISETRTISCIGSIPGAAEAAASLIE